MILQHSHSDLDSTDAGACADDNTKWRALGLSRCAQLDSLCLHMHYSRLSHDMDGHKAFSHAVGAYTQVLAHHPPPHLRHLTLRIPIYLRPGCVDVTRRRELWCHFDDAISRLPTLETVTLEVRSLETLERAEEHALSMGFQRALARVHARGILYIRFEVSSSALVYLHWQLNVHDDLCRGSCRLTLPTVRLNFCRPAHSCERT